MSTDKSRHLTQLQRLRSKVEDSLAQWKTFWFAPEDPITLGMIRILTGAMLAYNLLVWGLDLQAFFRSDGLQPLAAIRAFYGSDPIFSFLFYVPDEWLTIVHWTCFGVAVLMSAGVCSRLTTILCFLITISYSQRVPVANFGLDQILGLLCLYSAIGPSGAALSIDSLWRARRSRNAGRQVDVVPLSSCRMTLRLIQIHLCIIYFWAGFAKLKGDSWWTGEAMWQVLANQEYQTIDLTWLAWIPWAPYLIAHVTVAWEVFFCVLIWNKKLRPIMLVVGTGMHFGIGAFLGMWTFGLVMTYAYFAFSSPPAWRRRLHAIAPGFFAEPVQGLTVDEIVANSGEFLSGNTQLLLVAATPKDRSILRSYFDRHDMQCKAAMDSATAFRIIADTDPEAIVVYGSRFRVWELETLIEDFADAFTAPILAVVSVAQQEAMSDKVKRRVQLQLQPATPREIREELNQLLFAIREPDQQPGIDPLSDIEPLNQHDVSSV